MDPSDQVRFNGWTLHRRSGELERDGQRIRLQSQPLRVLEELLARPGELVSRETLIARLWPRGVLDFDTALNSAVRRLRTALRDHAETPRYIETIPRRGYRFIGALDEAPLAAVTECPSASPSLDPRPSPPSPAVDQGSTPALRWLGATAVATAITVMLWALGSGRYESTAIDAPATATPSAEVQERLERAAHFLKRRAAGDAARARQYFDEALAIDPDVAQAWAGLASAHFIEVVEGSVPAETGLARARDAAERALALDPDIAEAHLRLASYRWFLGDNAVAERHLRDALRLEPNNSLALGQLASIAAYAGRLDDAIALQRRSVQLDPLAAAYRFNLASLLYLAGHFEEARERLNEVRELVPRHPAAEELLGLLSILEGRPAEALTSITETLPGAVREQLKALAYQALGDQVSADAALTELVALAQAGDAFRIAEVYAYRGEVDAAFAWLSTGYENAIARGPLDGNARLIWVVQLSPWLRPLHHDPRWSTALADSYALH